MCTNDTTSHTCGVREGTGGARGADGGGDAACHSQPTSAKHIDCQTPVKPKIGQLRQDRAKHIHQGHCAAAYAVRQARAGPMGLRPGKRSVSATISPSGISSKKCDERETS